MRSAAVLCLILCVASTPRAVLAQAATGGTNDTAAPRMVFPIRPRDEPPGTTATPNISGPQQPVPRLRRLHRHRGHVHR